MKKILYLSCILFFCGYVFSQEAKPCPGVLINGVCWAKSNVDKPRTFASTPEAFGMLYQWNRKKAWPHNTEATGWDNTNAPGDYWETINNPCPKGWRVPNEEEINSIKDCDYVSENYICKFTDPNSGNTMVIPRTSRRNERGEYSEDYIWCYWVISAYNQYYAFTISNVPYIRLRELPKNWGLPVRCVADWNVQECEDKEEEVEVTIDKNKLPYTWRDTVFQEGTMSGTYIFRRIQALTGCDSIVTLKLTVKSECDKPCPGVLINGVCWAKSNVDKPGTFAPTPESWGMLYQWNRKKAWAHNTDTTGWDDTYAAGDYWEAINDPCPTGWRVPKEEEINSIIDCDYVNENYIYKFTDPNSGNTIIMPYTPTRWQGGRWVNGRGAWDYWFASAHNDVDAYSTTPTPFIRLISLPKKWAHPVRCVADWNVPECEEIKRDTSVTICAKDLPYDFCDTTFEEGTMSGTYVFQRIQALTGCDSIVTLKLTVTQEAKPIDPQCYPGVLIDGVFWSEYNVDAPGTFTPTPEAFGMFYQWNSNVPIAHGETMRIKDITEPVWEDANNPCPDGWRIPTLEETERLFSSSSQRVQKNGINGWEFKNEMTGKTIFIPIAGYWYIDHVGCENEDGDYWTSHIKEIRTNPTLYEIRYICLNESTNFINIVIPPRAASVRCVRDRLPGIECSERDTFVTICEKELPYPFADTVFGEGTVSGIYTFHRSQSVTGYDSIVHLHLTVQEIPPLEFFGEICQGGNYTENDFNLYAVMRDTIVRDTIPTQRGCDSVRILDLRVHPRYDTVVYDTVCQGDPYHGHGFTLTDAQPSDDGTSLAFHRTAQSIHGCDSVIHLYLFVGKTYLFETGREICQGDTVMWRGKQYDTEGTYEEPFITVHGCDSVYRLHLTVHPSPRLEFFGEVCQGKSYNEDGFFVPSATKDTIVRQELKTRWGCDSVRTLYLTVHPVYETIVYDTVCEGDPYHGYGFTLTNAQPSGDGTSLAFHRTAQSIHGCDSVIHLNLFVGETYLFETGREICQGDTVMWRGKQYDKEGTYEETFTTVHGCDSVYRLHLTVHPSPRLEFFGEVCQGKSYNEDGFFVPSATKDTIVRQELTTRWGCDSVRTLYLTVYPRCDTVVYDTVCQGDPYYGYGFTLTNAQPSGDGTSLAFYRIAQSIHGCDSVIHLNLFVGETYLFETGREICQGDTVMWRGKQYDKEGTYEETFSTVHGCDSVYRLHLTVHSSPRLEFSGEVCQGKSYNEYGFFVPSATKDTIVRQELKTRWGCDSVRTLYLTVYPRYDTVVYDTVCQGDPYHRHGVSISHAQPSGDGKPAMFRHTYPSIHGCDSTVTLFLTVHPISDTILYDAICRGDGYKNHGFSLDAAQFPKEGTYSFSRKERNMYGCDSTILLSLTVHPDYTFPRTEHICQGETFEFRDKVYDATGFYADRLETVHGCDSVYTLLLTVHPVYDVRLEGVFCEGEEYVRDGFHVKEPGTHVLRLTSVHGCDSTVTLTLTEEKKVEGSIGFLLEDCTRHGYGFEFSPSLPVREWVWEMGDGTAYRTEEGYHRYADSGTYRVLLRTLTDNGCGNEFLHVQRVPPYLDRVTVRADRQVVDEEYPTVRFRAEVLGGMECEWDFGDGTTGKGSETEHTYATAEARTYAVTLRVTNGDGCITEEEVTVEAVVFPKAVNTFSPNGDGINDVFMAGFRIEVMNRNGLKIYCGEDGWDGTYKGGEAKEDTYFYRVTFRTATGERTKTGYVNLIR